MVIKVNTQKKEDSPKKEKSDALGKFGLWENEKGGKLLYKGSLELVGYDDYKFYIGLFEPSDRDPEGTIASGTISYQEDGEFYQFGRIILKEFKGTGKIVAKGEARLLGIDAELNDIYDVLVFESTSENPNAPIFNGIFVRPDKGNEAPSNSKSFKLPGSSFTQTVDNVEW